MKAMKNHIRQNYQMLIKIIQSALGHCLGFLASWAPGPLGQCFERGKDGHWVQAGPNPYLRTPGPCPMCHVEGLWLIDCPCAPSGMKTSNADHPLTELLGLTIDY